MQGTAPIIRRGIPQGQPAAVPGMSDTQNWVWYDSQTAAAAGQSQLTFFQTPLGASGRTLEDTNFAGAGSLPAGMSFVLQEIMVNLIPGSTVVPGTFGSGIAPKYVNDVYAWNKAGVVQFNYSSKTYVQDSPIGRFPLDTRLTGFGAAADATTAAASLQTLLDYAAPAGRLWRVADMRIDPQVNFNVTLSWPNGVVALPSTVAGKAFVYLKGYLARFVQ
jgi:hypothetical protein